MFVPFHAETNREWDYRQTRPYLVWLLVAVYILVHWQVTRNFSTEGWMDIVYRFGVVKYRLHWYSFLTCTFLHGGWLHLFGNVFFLYVYGAPLERLLGSVRFALLYIIGAFLSMLLHTWTLSPILQDVPAIGASGAISAVLGAFFVLLPGARLKCLLFFFLRPLLITLPACVVLGLWFLGQLYFSIEFNTSSESIAFWAHVAGFAAGTGAGTFLYRQLKHAFRRAAIADLAPLSRAWTAFQQHHLQAAADEYARLDLEPGTDNGLESSLLSGLLAAEYRHDRAAANQDFLRAFKKAVNTFNHAFALSLYLQMRQRQPAAEIPPFVHRDAGVAATACGFHELAIAAYSDAIAGGLEDGREMILSRTEAMLRNKFQLPAQADQVRALAQAI
jgi:membrane associated rhomboid family serine protease